LNDLTNCSYKFFLVLIYPGYGFEIFAKNVKAISDLTLTIKFQNSIYQENWDACIESFKQMIDHVSICEEFIDVFYQSFQESLDEHVKEATICLLVVIASGFIYLGITLIQVNKHILWDYLN